MLRITGGKFRGRKIKTLKGRGTRPILSRVRKSLFDIIGNRIVKSDFLDLYAGIGSVGIEALSRGASSATFVEKEGRAIQIIKHNLSILGLLEKSKIYRRDVLDWLSLVANEDEKFDIIFVGPPYFKGLIEQTLENIANGEILKKDGLIFVQHHRKEKISFSDSLKLIDHRKYGDMILSIYGVRSYTSKSDKHFLGTP